MSESSLRHPATPVVGNARRPTSRWLWVVIGLSALMVYRLVALAGLSDLGDGTPEFWVVAFTGDAFMGVTAPIVAVMLWKTRGLAIWTTAIAWHVIGLKDYLVGAQFLAVELPDGASLSMVVPILQ